MEIARRSPRLGLIKGAGFPIVDRDALPRGLVANPIYQFNWSPDPVSGMGQVKNRGPEGSNIVPTAYGPGLPCFYTQIYHNIPYSLAIQGFSRAVVFKTGTSVVSDGRIIGDTNGAGNDKIIDISGGKASFWIYDGAVQRVTGTTSLAVNTVYMVVGVYDKAANSIRVYVNGVLEGTLGSIGTPQTYASYMLAGVDGGDGNTATQIILASYAANVCWRADEVLSLWRAPYGHLIWPDEKEYYSPDLLLTKVPGGTTYNETISDSISVGDSFSVGVAAVTTISDSVALGDSLTAQVTATTTISDSVSLGDSLASKATFATSISDSVSLLDAMQDGPNNANFSAIINVVT